MKNKTASLITIHTGPNFGTILQVIASVTVLKRHGVETTIVNYIPPRDTYKRIWNNTCSAIKDAKGISKIKRIFGGLRDMIVLRDFNRIYIGTLRKYCKLSSPIYNSDNFEMKCPKADFYITGSDQVWNTIHNEGIDEHYFFSGINGNKIALSSSIGMNFLSEQEKKVFMQSLSSYSSISVREDKAVELLREIGVSSTHVIDPTLMLNREQWVKIVSFERIIKAKYLLVYTPYNIHDMEEIYRFARKVATEKGVRIVSFSWNKTKDPYADDTMCNVSPVDFLSLMYHADYVITNSFHGTAFSINMNRIFWVYMPTHFTSRIESILEMCQLKDRIMSDDGASCNINQDIDYERVNAILDAERARTDDFIDKAINS